MLDPAAAVRHIAAAGFTHVVWIPDSFVGPWESALASSSQLKLIRPCREGEAIGIAAGLMLGLARPVVIIQCTGLFEAGDSLRNVVHDLNLPLKLIVGVRSYGGIPGGQDDRQLPGVHGAGADGLEGAVHGVGRAGRGGIRGGSAGAWQWRRGPAALLLGE